MFNLQISQKYGLYQLNYDQIYYYHGVILKLFNDMLIHCDQFNRILSMQLRSLFSTKFIFFTLQRFNYFNENSIKNQCQIFLNKQLCGVFLKIYTENINQSASSGQFQQSNNLLLQ